MESYDFLFKFLVLGDSNTGKSCLLHNFVSGSVKVAPSHTIGIEFASKFVTLGQNRIKLQIWDTAGQERFRSVTKTYYRSAAGALIVFDITSRKSFESVQHWLADLHASSPDIVAILVGNKSDLNANREVSSDEGRRKAEDNGLNYVETSAVTGENVEECFLKCARTILTRVETGVLSADGDSGIQYGTSVHIGRIEDLMGSDTNRSGCNC